MLSTKARWQLGGPAPDPKPFAHFRASGVLDRASQAMLLDWFEGDAPWRLVETDFYEQWEFDLLGCERPATASDLFGPAALRELREAMEDRFATRFEERVTAVAHKLLPGQRIAIHNDFLVGEETHRLTVQLNRGLSDGDGGFFMLFSSFDARDVHSVLRPQSGSAIGFQISERSHHAVSRIHGGERFTLVFSFFAHDRRRAA